MIMHINTNRWVGYQFDFIWVQIIIQHLSWGDDGRVEANPMNPIWEGDRFLHMGCIPNTNLGGEGIPIRK